MALQKRSIDQADRFFTVSALWQNALAGEGKTSADVGNGVDTSRFSPRADETDARLRDRLDLPPGPVFLCVGGIEARKNTLRILDAFAQVRAVRPDAQLVIAGGVSLLDHGAYQSQFRSRLEELARLRSAVHIIGAVADQDLPALFRLADTLVFPSSRKVSGLWFWKRWRAAYGCCVLHCAIHGLSFAKPCGLVRSAQSSLDCRSDDGFARHGDPPRLTSAGLELARRYSWQRTAEAHLATYLDMTEPAHA